MTKNWIWSKLIDIIIIILNNLKKLNLIKINIRRRHQLSIRRRCCCICLTRSKDRRSKRMKYQSHLHGRASCCKTGCSIASGHSGSNQLRELLTYQDWSRKSNRLSQNHSVVWTQLKQNWWQVSLALTEAQCLDDV